MTQPPLDDEDVMWCLAYASAMALTLLGAAIGDPENYPEVDEMDEFCDEVAHRAVTKIMKRLRLDRKH